MVAGLEPARGRESIAPGRSIPTALPLSYTMRKVSPGRALAARAPLADRAGQTVRATPEN